MIKNLRNRTLPEWTAGLVLLGLCLAGFGLLLPRLGFYWDDWAKFLVSRLFGLSGYWAYYAEDRPLSGWTHIVLTPLLGASPLAWQVFALAMRWLTALGIYLTLRLLWPGRRQTAFLTAAIFVVYPVFTQQSIALTFHQQWMQYGLYFLSTTAMLYALRRGRGWPVWVVIGVLGMALELTITEYFVGLEALRLVILWVALVGENDKVAGKIKAWLVNVWPYLLVLGGYVVWRLFFIRLTGEDPYKAEILYNLFSQPLPTLTALLRMMTSDTLYVLLGSWSEVAGLGLEQNNPLRFTFSVWMIALSAAVMLGWYFILYSRQREEEAATRKWILAVLAVGVLGVWGGCLPGWATNRPVIFDFHSNRYAMPAMFGAALLWVGAIELLVPRRAARAVLLGAIAAGGIVFHLNVANDYAGIWQNQLDFYWQLYWRAPALQEDTALLAENELFPNQGGFSTSAAINLLYPQEKNRPHLAYWFYNLQPRFAIEPSASPLGIPLKTQFRTLTYEGQTGESIVFFYDPGRANCLWALNEKDALNADLPELTHRMLPASDLSRIQSQPGSGYPDPALFGPEPAHGWCYFYQKAALAVQMEDWEEAARLADEARANPENTPKNPWFKTSHEWIPFIKGYAHVGRWHEAQEIAIQAANVYQAKYRDEFCGMWQNLLSETPDSEQRMSATFEMETSLNCKFIKQST